MGCWKLQCVNEIPTLCPTLGAVPDRSVLRWMSRPSKSDENRFGSEEALAPFGEVPPLLRQPINAREDGGGSQRRKRRENGGF